MPDPRISLLLTHIQFPIVGDAQSQYIFDGQQRHLGQIDDAPWMSEGGMAATTICDDLALMAGLSLINALSGTNPADMPQVAELAPVAALLLGLFEYLRKAQMVVDATGKVVLNVSGWGWMQNALGNQTDAAVYQDTLGFVWADALTGLWAAAHPLANAPLQVAVVGGGSVGAIAAHVLHGPYGQTLFVPGPIPQIPPVSPTEIKIQPLPNFEPMVYADNVLAYPDGKASRRERRRLQREKKTRKEWERRFGRR
jgi:hypothetical protein